MEQYDENFDANNEMSLPDPLFTVRDNLGALALQILVARDQLNVNDYRETLRNYHEILKDLHKIYDESNGNF